MKRTALSLVAVLGLALPALAQSDAKTPAPAAKQPEHKPAIKRESIPAKPEIAKPAAQPANDASMDAWMKAAQPSENHKLLEPMIGVWSAKCKFWMGGPETPATESSGTMTNKWVLGGRFIRSEFKGEFMNQPFEGLGYFGFDNAEQKYIGSWADTLSTTMMTSTGTYDAAKKTFTMKGSFKEPGTGQNFTSRETTTIVDANTTKFEMYHTGPDGKENKVGEITYTRSGSAPAAPAHDAPKPTTPK